MITATVLALISLRVMKPCIFGGGLALARQVNVVLSATLGGSRVRMLVNDSLEPETEDMVTLASLLDRAVVPLIQETSISLTRTSVSVALLIEMLQVRVSGTILPANSGPGGTVMTTLGVETVHMHGDNEHNS